MYRGSHVPWLEASGANAAHVREGRYSQQGCNHCPGPCRWEGSPHVYTAPRGLLRARLRPGPAPRAPPSGAPTPSKTQQPRPGRRPRAVAAAPAASGALRLPQLTNSSLHSVWALHQRMRGGRGGGVPVRTRPARRQHGPSPVRPARPHARPAGGRAGAPWEPLVRGSPFFWSFGRARARAAAPRTRTSCVRVRSACDGQCVVAEWMLGDPGNAAGRSSPEGARSEQAGFGGLADCCGRRRGPGGLRAWHGGVRGRVSMGWGWGHRRAPRLTAAGSAVPV
jgi:hypothetical protein